MSKITMKEFILNMKKWDWSKILLGFITLLGGGSGLTLLNDWRRDRNKYESLKYFLQKEQPYSKLGFIFPGRNANIAEDSLTDIDDSQNLCLIEGFQGIGKTSYFLNLLDNESQKGRPVLYLSLKVGQGGLESALFDQIRFRPVHDTQSKYNINFSSKRNIS